MKRRSGATISPGQSQYVLQRLIADRTISQRDVQKYLGDMQDEIRQLEERLQLLRQAGDASEAAEQAAPARGGRGGARKRRRGRPSKSAAKKAAAAPRRARPRRRKPAPDSARTASRKLQGQYMSLIRQIPRNKRAQYQQIARDRSREDAINQMRTDLAK